MQIKRKFVPGEEWIYLKVYGGPKLLERLVVEEVFPLLEDMIGREDIQHYFFIRYADPEYHIRLRIYNQDPMANYRVMEALTEALCGKVRDRSISRITYDTYHREIERYGIRSMEAAEQLFYLDSAALLSFFRETDSSNAFRWLYAMYWIDHLMDAFQFSEDHKAVFYESRFQNYAREHNLLKPARVVMDKKYRKVSSQIDQMFQSRGEENIIQIIATGVHTFSRRSERLVDKILDLQSSGILEIELESFVSSLIHMHVNRMYRTRPRVYEMLIYYFLNKFHKSRVARARYSVDS